MATTDMVWIDDAVPAGATTAGASEGWVWVSANPTPYAGGLAHQSGVVSGMHEHAFYDASDSLTVASGDTLFAYVYIDPANSPRQVELQWRVGTNWGHRAYWGESLLPWGAEGTIARQYMGPLPVAGQWVRLEVPANAVGLGGTSVNGMAFTLYDGKATWDYTGRAAVSVPLELTVADSASATETLGILAGLALADAGAGADALPGPAALAKVSETGDPAPVGQASLIISTDNANQVYFNGALIGSADNWEQSSSYTLALQSGANVVAVKGMDITGIAAMIAQLTLPDGSTVVSDGAWKVSTALQTGWQSVGFDDSGWVGASSYGVYGVSPWDKRVAGFPSDSTASWIWSSNNDADNTVYVRYSFYYEPPLAIVADSASATETLGILAGLALADAGAGADALPGPAALAKVSETGAGTDALGTLAVSLALTDAGSGLDAVSVLLELLKTVLDSAAGVDALAVTVSLGVTDAGTGADADPAIAALVALLESAGAVDVIVRTAPGEVASITFRLERRSITFRLERRSIAFGALSARSINLGPLH